MVSEGYTLREGHSEDEGRMSFRAEPLRVLGMEGDRSYGVVSSGENYRAPEGERSYVKRLSGEYSQSGGASQGQGFSAPRGAAVRI
jgi:hypothetical protein